MLKVFLRSPGALPGTIGVGILVLVSIFAPVFLGHQAQVLNVARGHQNPSIHHLLGTDQLGRDIFVRLLIATRLSVVSGLAATALAAAIGIPLGAGAALLPGRLRAIGLRGIDLLIAFPSLLIAIGFAAVLGPGVRSAVLGIGLGISFAFARVTSSLTLAVRDRDYVLAARILGVRQHRLLLRHILPNIADTLAITTTVAIAAAIVTMAGLSFLGLGIQLPQFDWGRMLTDGVQAFYVTPAAALGPGAAIAFAALSFGFLGEALARVTNPVLWATAGSAGRTNGSAEAPAQPAEGHAPGPTAGGGTLVVRDLHVGFPAGGTISMVVHGVSLSVGPGEMVGIVGESGSGKTMTAMAIAQLVPHPGKVSGTITLNGQDLHGLALHEIDKVLGTRLAVVFQDPMSALNPALKVGTQLTEGSRYHGHLSRGEAAMLAVRRLAEVNIATPEQMLRRYPQQLSGGQRQRVLIAMGLMSEPVLLIADEPTTALDVTVQAQIMDVLASINRDHGTAILFISHNLGLVAQNCHRVIVMYAGRVVEELTAEQLQERPLHPYTRALLSAVPDMTQPRDQALMTIPGQIPDVTALPGGCPYHPRCPLAEDVCRTDRPPLEARSEPGHPVACWVANRNPS